MSKETFEHSRKLREEKTLKPARKSERLELVVCICVIAILIAGYVMQEHFHVDLNILHYVG